ncbi:MAG: hypothetical protein J6P19_04590 [Acetobacter sp.]|nr:hypothetical protein [Acetobacter sp.]
MRDEYNEPHSGIYLRKYNGDAAVSIGIELMFDTIENAAEYTFNEYEFDNEDISYHLETTYGECMAIVTKDKIKYL